MRIVHTLRKPTTTPTNLNPPSKKRKTSLILTNQGDRVFVSAKTIINEVMRVCHKVF